jgi:energy-coupling factor transporter ATP-binding protein EcfA2
MEFTIAGSGLTGLVGPNGAGKSVLLLALAGLEQPEQVAVKWNRTPDVPPIVALQYPELQVFEDLVADELAFAAVSRGMARTCALDRAAGCLRELGFDPDLVLGRRTWTLSTGEKRLIEVVGALIAPAGLLLLDEPTAGLDSRRRAALGSLVERRASAGPVVVASQDLEWVEGLRGVRVELGG